MEKKKCLHMLKNFMGRAKNILLIRAKRGERGGPWPIPATPSSVFASWYQIDRFLLSLDLEAKILDLIQNRLSRLCSDHFPILLDCRVFMEPKQHFKFGKCG